MLETWAELPMQFSTSAESGAGKAEILSYIGQINNKLQSK
jgi:hypothetical protein